MSEAIKYLQSYHIDTTSRIRAVQDAGALEFDANTYRQMIEDLTGVEKPALTDDEARPAFMYMVEAIVTGIPVDVAYTSALPKAASFVKVYAWTLAKPESSYEPVEGKVDALGQPKQKKGAKKAAAIRFYKEHQGEFTSRKDWIEALMENVGLTKGAASTYHHNLKNGIWH